MTTTHKFPVQPDSNTVRLNITVVGSAPPAPLKWERDLPAKDVKPWVMTTNKMTSGSSQDSAAPVKQPPPPRDGNFMSCYQCQELCP